MRLPRQRPLAVGLSLVLVACLVLVTVGTLGNLALMRMLSRDAVVRADLWARAALHGDVSDIPGALNRAKAGSFAQALGIAEIDGLVLIPRDGPPTAAGPSGPEAVEHFRRVTDPTRDTGGSPYALPSGAYTADSVNWLQQQTFRSWVLFPPAAEGQTRLAARVEQTHTASALSDSFIREVLFSGGVAIATFLSFMAGFSYRQRQLAAENAAIRFLALHDELTGLPNRKQFEEFMTQALDAVSQGRHKTALFILDLDGFKSVNDTLGHPVGDGLLQAAAKRLKSSLRTGDLLARLSGDEFAIVAPRVTDPAMLAPLAERVLQLVASPFCVEGHDIQIGCSIGLAVAPDNGGDLATLMRNADFALYRAKSEGRRTWRFFDPTMAEDLASRRTLQDGLRHALAKDHFELLYQPQVELATGRTVGYEAMLRWRLPGNFLVPASAFVPVAEETGLVVPIGEWVIRQAARDCAQMPPERTVAINLSATQLKRDGIENFIAETLSSHKIAPDRIAIEVNESIFGRNEAAAFSRLKAIGDAGVRIVMDSYGVGTLSLGLLSRFSFDKIKVDRSIFTDDDQKNAAVLVAICTLGRSLGFRVAGQGVETIEHAQLLRAAGCSEAQGYYFAPPMSLEHLLRREQDGQQPPLARIA